LASRCGWPKDTSRSGQKDPAMWQSRHLHTTTAWQDLTWPTWSVSEEIHSSGQVHLSWHVAKRLCQWSIHTYSHHFACANALHRDWKCSLFSVCTSILTHCLIPNQIYCKKVCISHHVQALYKCTNQ
jgi:hypothetical protein